MSELISPTGFTNLVGAELVSNKPDKPQNKDIQIKEPKLIVLDKDIKIINTFLKEHKIKNKSKII